MILSAQWPPRYRAIRILRHFRRFGPLETHGAKDILTSDHGGGADLAE